MNEMTNENHASRVAADEAEAQKRADLIAEIREAFKEPKPTTNANILMPDGAHYPVSLTWLPRVGDTIELQSCVDRFQKSFIVDRVTHHVRDATPKIEGTHTVSIEVKPG
jgi:hypothetical protein